MKKIQYKGLSTLEILEGANNYNDWIASEILRGAKTPMIEIGSGIGNLSEKFMSLKPLTLSDNDKGLVKILQERFLDTGVRSLYLDIEREIDSSLNNQFHSVVAVNVLEHVKNDKRALRNISALLKKGGTIRLLVPAKQFAYTRLDKDLGHYRRYEKDALEQHLIDAGFKINDIYFFNIVGLISWIVRDKVEKKNIHLKPYQIALFDWMVPILRFVEANIRPPVGISLIVVATKK